MTASILPQDRTARRISKALTIVALQECEPLEDGRWRVRDTANGSGTWHQTTTSTCSCADFTFRRVPCKHIGAVQREEAALADYCNQWNEASDAQRAAVEPATTGAWYKGEYYTTEQLAAAEQARAARPRCRTCGAGVVIEQHYIGGRGYCHFEVCSVDSSHPARRTS